MSLPQQSKKRLAAIADGTFVPKARKAMKRSKMKTARKPTGEAALFREIWDSRPHQCEVCGTPIHEAGPANFSHLLPKNAYPEFRLDPRNVILKDTRCHDLWHQHHTGLRYSHGWGWVCDRYNELKLEAYR